MTRFYVSETHPWVVFVRTPTGLWPYTLQPHTDTPMDPEPAVLVELVPTEEQT